MNLVRSTYYYRPKGRCKDDEALIERIEAICAEFPRYGYRRVTAQLRHQGERVNHKRVARIMRERGLIVRPRRHKVRTRDGRCKDAVFPNLARHFVPRGPNELLGRRYHLHPHDCGLCLPGRDPGCLVAARGRLRGVTADRHATDDRGAASGTGESPTTTRLHPSYGPRQPLRLGGLPVFDGRVGPAGINEPARKSLRQRSMRELHQNGEIRRGISERLRDLPGRREALTAVPGPGLQ